MAKNAITRREALAKLGGVSLAAYVAPALVALSDAAHASGSSVPTPPTPPSPPSQPSSASGPDERDERSTDHCRASTVRAGDPVISADDYRRAQESVDAGYAKPLLQIWPGIVEEYTGNIVSVTFTGFRYRPRYRLKAVSPTGRLETVIVSARTGEIIRIVGC